MGVTDIRPLYEIENEIFDCFDAETGEILDEDKLNQLEMERGKKIEGVALAVKELRADIDAYKAEKSVFSDKIKKAERQVEGYLKWLENATQGRKYHSARVDVSYRSSEAVDIPDESLVPTEYIKWKTEGSPDKTAIKQAIKAGIEVEGCRLVQKQNIQVK